MPVSDSYNSVYCNEKNVDLFDSLFFSYVFLD